MNDDLRQLQQRLKLDTSRAGPSPLPAAPPLDTLLPADAAGTQASLWLGLAALDLHEGSGFVPADAGTIPTTSPAPAEVMRPCPPEAESTLASLLLGVRPPALLTQWMGNPQHHAARLPARFLPALLESAMRHATLRPALLPVLGERGRWLAALREDWAWARAGGENDRDMWETGCLDQRIGILRRRRECHPEAARATDRDMVERTAGASCRPAAPTRHRTRSDR